MLEEVARESGGPEPRYDYAKRKVAIIPSGVPRRIKAGLYTNMKGIR
jgi:hypothetical protein